MTEPFDHLLEKYARLVVRVGANVQPGQEVVVNALPEQADAARAITAEAYRVGASKVTLQYRDPFEKRAAVEHGRRSSSAPPRSTSSSRSAAGSRPAPR